MGQLVFLVCGCLVLGFEYGGPLGWGVFLVAMAIGKE